MLEESAFGPTVSQVRLERLRLFMSQSIPDDIAGIDAHLDLLYEPMIRGQLVQIRASVTAAKREEGPYELSDRVVETHTVPERPVRDGMLLWLTRHTPEPMSRFFLRRLRLREIPERRIVKMQELHYYGCPHIRVGSDKADVHLMWMATQSGQIAPDSSEQNA